MTFTILNLSFCPAKIYSNLDDKELIMEGDTVVVRTYGGEPKAARVWKIGRGFVFVCSEANYQALRIGKRVYGLLVYQRKMFLDTIRSKITSSRIGVMILLFGNIW
jgi:hypothetical protein